MTNASPVVEGACERNKLIDELSKSDCVRWGHPSAKFLPKRTDSEQDVVEFTVSCTVTYVRSKCFIDKHQIGSKDHKVVGVCRVPWNEVLKEKPSKMKEVRLTDDHKSLIEKAERDALSQALDYCQLQRFLDVMIEDPVRYLERIVLNADFYEPILVLAQRFYHENMKVASFKARAEQPSGSKSEAQNLRTRLTELTDDYCQHLGVPVTISINGSVSDRNTNRMMMPGYWPGMR